MAINCEDNALLISVEQIGAVCHTGHPTCFFRDIEEDESLTVTTDRLFDPEVVYGIQTDLTQSWYGALEWLKSQSLEDQSSTSRLLRTPGAPIAKRAGDELQELSGVLDGSHRHVGLLEDTITESSQSLYWLALAAIQAGLTWSDIRPDRALDSATPGMAIGTVARMLEVAAREWMAPDHVVSQQSVHATMALVGQAAKTVQLVPLMLIEYDLKEMQTRNYLRPWFDNDDA